MERGLLSDNKLSKHYDEVVWMYLYQDFSHSERDRAAERVAIRFGITAWPQHFLVDPYTLQVIGDTGRSLDTFAPAVQAARVRKTKRGITPDELAERDATAASLEGKASLARARKHLKHEDVVVRYRAIERLREDQPDAIAKAATSLLAQPHDQTRFTVCSVLAKSGGGKHAAAIADVLESLLSEPAGSKNPNMLRYHATRALAQCGGPASIDTVARFATTGAFLNSLTGSSVDCLAAIAKRHRTARKAVAKHLVEAFPEPTDDEQCARSCVHLARRVHDALAAVTGKRVPFPDSYSGASRKSLVAAWARKLRSRR